MNIYINTRTIGSDYRYLIHTPNTDWLGDYKDKTSFEHPTIIFEKLHSGFRAFLGGMPSNRRDKVGTIIRYSFLCEGELTEYGSLLGLLDAWFLAIKDDTAKTQLAQKLTDLFTEEELLPLFERELSDAKATADGVDDKMIAWLSTFANTQKTEFTQRIDELMTGANEGVVCYLNFIENQQEAEQNAMPHKTITVWLPDGFKDIPPKLVVKPQVPSSVTVARPQELLPGKAVMSPMLKVLVAVAVVVVIILLMVILGMK